MWFANWVDVMFECCLVLKNDHQKKQVIALSINWFILINYCNKQVVVQSQKIIFFQFLPGNETQLSFQRKLELDFWGNIFCSSSVIKISFFAISMKQFLWKCTMYMFDQFVQKFIINVSFKFPSTMCRSFWKIIIIRNICDYYNIIIYVTTFNSYKLRR